MDLNSFSITEQNSKTVYVKIQKLPAISKKRQLVVLGRQNLIRVGLAMRSHQMDRMFKVNQRPLWQIMSRAMGQHPEPLGQKRKLVSGRTRKNFQQPISTLH